MNGKEIIINSTNLIPSATGPQFKKDRFIALGYVQYPELRDIDLHLSSCHSIILRCFFSSRGGQTSNPGRKCTWYITSPWWPASHSPLVRWKYHHHERQWSLVGGRAQFIPTGRCLANRGQKISLLGERVPKKWVEIMGIPKRVTLILETWAL